MRPTGVGLRRAARDERGVGLVEIALALVVVAIVGAVLYAYIGSTTRTVALVQEQRPLTAARLTADRATLTAIRGAIMVYYGQQGRWPESKETVASLLNPPPAFQCAGNDYTYDAATGQVNLLVDDASRC
jgi:type II secretory pathway pseudopilin PulG